MSTAKQLTGVSVGVIRHSGKCTHELNRHSGEGKVIFDSPEHAAGWQQEQAYLHPHDYRAMNVYQCPFFKHFHLTSRAVHMANGILTEDGAKSVATSQPIQPPNRSYKWVHDNSMMFNPEAIGAAFKDGMTRHEIAEKSGATYENVCAILRKLGLGAAPHPRTAGKAEPPVRKLATSLQEIDLQQQTLEAQMRKLAEDRAQIIELTRIKVEWAVEPVSIRVGKHNESLVLTIADWNTVMEGLRTLLDTPQEEVKL